ncbi:hypothetical protein [Flavobacterium sp.]|uniref:hypothetical protein n=1 Tax=Flavobacterium sp. TaxID=239 RepID=UPI003753B2D7
MPASKYVDQGSLCIKWVQNRTLYSCVIYFGATRANSTEVLRFKVKMMFLTSMDVVDRCCFQIVAFNNNGFGL